MLKSHHHVGSIMKLLVATGAICALTARAPADAKPKAPVEKTVRLVFPSKRAITAPMLPGKYEIAGDQMFDSLSYTEVSPERGIVNGVVMTVASTGSCAAARSAIDDAKDLASEPMKALEVAWYVSYLRFKNTRRIRHACLALKSGRVQLTIDEPAAASGWPELEPLAVAMLAARK